MENEQAVKSRVWRLFEKLRKVCVVFVSVVVSLLALLFVVFVVIFPAHPRIHDPDQLVRDCARLIQTVSDEEGSEFRGKTIYPGETPEIPKSIRKLSSNRVSVSRNSVSIITRGGGAFGGDGYRVYPDGAPRFRDYRLEYNTKDPRINKFTYSY